MTDDLNKLLERRQEIDNLHNVLMGIINHSTSKKIDVEDLRIKLAESMRRDRHVSTIGGSTLGASAAEISLKKQNRKQSSGRSKSPMDFSYGNQSSSDVIPALENNISGNHFGRSDDNEPPSWYRSLKKNSN